MQGHERERRCCVFRRADHLVGTWGEDRLLGGIRLEFGFRDRPGTPRVWAADVAESCGRTPGGRQDSPRLRAPVACTPAARTDESSQGRPQAARSEALTARSAGAATIGWGARQGFLLLAGCATPGRRNLRGPGIECRSRSPVATSSGCTWFCPSGSARSGRFGRTERGLSHRASSAGSCATRRRGRAARRRPPARSARGRSRRRP